MDPANLVALTVLPGPVYQDILAVLADPANLLVLPVLANLANQEFLADLADLVNRLALPVPAAQAVPAVHLPVPAVLPVLVDPANREVPMVLMALAALVVLVYQKIHLHSIIRVVTYEYPSLVILVSKVVFYDITL